MTRETLINNGHAIEVQRLVKELHNDMDLGKAVRKLASEIEENWLRLKVKLINHFLT